MARTLDYMIETMTAARDGKAVECAKKNEGDWELPSEFHRAWAWDWVRFDYRIAPEPRKARECWVVFNNDGSVIVDKYSAHEQDHSKCGGKCVYVHMREVLPE